MFGEISPGVEKTADESMSAIWFWTTPKGDLKQYLFIFRKPDKLDMELRNSACSRLGNVLYLYIKKGKETMKASDFQQGI